MGGVVFFFFFQFYPILRPAPSFRLGVRVLQQSSLFLIETIKRIYIAVYIFVGLPIHFCDTLLFGSKFSFTPLN